MQLSWCWYHTEAKNFDLALGSVFYIFIFNQSGVGWNMTYYIRSISDLEILMTQSQLPEVYSYNEAMGGKTKL